MRNEKIEKKHECTIILNSCIIFSSINSPCPLDPLQAKGGCK